MERPEPRKLFARGVPLISCTVAIVGALILAAGCAEDEKSTATSHPGDAILKDPFGYKPTMEDPNISGGSIGHFDKKAMKHDLDTFLNP